MRFEGISGAQHYAGAMRLVILGSRTAHRRRGRPTAYPRSARALLGLCHQYARQIVDALERKGLFEGAVDPTDRRARRLHLSPAVSPLFAPRDPSDHREVQQWLGALSEEEQRQRSGCFIGPLADRAS